MEDLENRVRLAREAIEAERKWLDYPADPGPDLDIEPDLWEEANKAAALFVAANDFETILADAERWQQAQKVIKWAKTKFCIHGSADYDPKCGPCIARRI